MSAHPPEHSKGVTSLSSDALHNRNCYQYLSHIVLPPAELFPKGAENLSIIANLPKKYDPTIAYGSLYTAFMQELETLLKQSELDHEAWDPFFISVYVNNSHILRDTYQHIRQIVKQKTPSSPPVKHTIQHSMRDEQRTLNLFTPAKTESLGSRFVDLYGPEYKPSYKTSLATKRYYRYNQQASSQELRFGTQAQVDYYFARVNPIFKRFLIAQARQQAFEARQDRPITHIYFNNLGLHRKKFTHEVYEGWFESSLTKQLHHLEKEHDTIMVITLPADKGLMAHDDVFHLEATEQPSQIKELFLNIAMESPEARLFVKDFHISHRARQMIFGSPTQARQTLEKLLDDSFVAVGLHPTARLSPAQRQAVWVHFIKYELPRHIIQEIRPLTYNFSCKDAIDRGGLSSAYYNLLCSFQTPTPMSRDEFEQALQAAPTMVKGRGMNDHLDVIWNALDHYIQTNREEIAHQDKKWLIEWRDANCPPARAGELLERRLAECLTDLSDLPEDAAQQGYEVLKSIKDANRHDPAHASLYLDAVVSTYAFAKQPELANDIMRQQAYDQLINKMDQLSAPSANLIKRFWMWLLSLLRGYNQVEPDETPSVTEKMKQGPASMWQKSRPHLHTEVHRSESKNLEKNKKGS